MMKNSKIDVKFFQLNYYIIIKEYYCSLKNIVFLKEYYCSLKNITVSLYLFLASDSFLLYK